MRDFLRWWITPLSMSRGQVLFWYLIFPPAIGIVGSLTLGYLMGWVVR